MGSTRSPEGYGIFYFLSFEVAPQVFSLKTISCILTFYIFRLYLREDFFSSTHKSNLVFNGCSKLFSSDFTSQHCSHSLSVLFICKEDFSLTSVFPYGLFLQGRESTLRIDVRPNSIPHNSLKMVLCINTSGSSLFFCLHTHSADPGRL